MSVVDLNHLRNEINYLSDEKLQQIGSGMSREDVDALAMLMPDDVRTSEKIEMLRSPLMHFERAVAQQRPSENSSNIFLNRDIRKI